MERPEFCTDEHLEYLDDLHESGVTNMYGAGAYPQEDFPLTRQESHKVLAYWMETFSERHQEAE